MREGARGFAARIRQRAEKRCAHRRMLPQRGRGVRQRRAHLRVRFANGRVRRVPQRGFDPSRRVAPPFDVHAFPMRPTRRLLLERRQNRRQRLERQRVHLRVARGEDHAELGERALGERRARGGIASRRETQRRERHETRLAVNAKRERVKPRDERAVVAG